MLNLKKIGLDLSFADWEIFRADCQLRRISEGDGPTRVVPNTLQTDVLYRELGEFSGNDLFS